MKLLITSLLFLAVFLPSQEEGDSSGKVSALTGTNWIGSADALGSKVFVALEFSGNRPGEVLLTFPNALVMRRPFAVAGSDTAPVISVSAGQQEIELRLEPRLNDGPLSIAGSMVVLGDDGESVAQSYPLSLAPWTAPEELPTTMALEGSVQLPGAGQELKIGLLLGYSDTSASARINIPSQSVFDFPCEAVRTDTTWRITASFGRPVVVSLDTKSQNDSNEYVGTMEQAGFVMNMKLEKVDEAEVAREKRPQTPKPPFPYTSEDVQVAHPDGHVLAGTFLRPEGDGRPPVVVFITGSGPQDRNETLMGHSPFLVLADYLARNGIASLRYDDRGVGESTGKFADALSTDFATDALAALAWVRERDDIDLKGVGLLGHSEGGLVAPIAFSMEPAAVDFAILLAGTGVDGGRILTSQTKRMMETEGFSDEGIDGVIERHEALMEAVRRDASAEETRDLYRALSDAQIELMRSVVGDEKADELKASVRQQLEDVVDPLDGWTRGFIKIDPRMYLSQMSCPVLALNGTKDVQVISELNLPEIQRAVTTGGGEITVIEYEGLNHLFQRANTGAVIEYAEIETTIEPEVLADIAQWILKITGKESS